ncbi:hypothetical protein N5079_25550 [Planotetraspora sp. A-T 1434]|uniref:hypothetical protein n=1 Tax=Planotetraspora sp. A-T 1434 TaxID=2979219 RepID=UPI0021C17BE0|nr:hypothetical protein [Planotetraspora sp. A-T 1434]MCT9933584.1 hypothetical protein [Planotetraspora sp. A-T 1434]
MTVVVLDAPSGPLLPYPSWLAGADVVLFTGRSPVEIRDTDGYAGVRPFARYEGSAEVERAVLALAEVRTVTAIVATASADSIRAGALRDHLGLPGQGRESAILFRDLVAMRQRLAGEAVPTVPFGAVRRVSDLYWFAHEWGFPLTVRRRRTSGWPTVATLRDEAEVREFTLGGISGKLESLPDLVAEPQTERSLVVTDLGSRLPDTGVGGADLPAVARAAFTALPPPTGPYPYAVEACRTAGGAWLVGSVACDFGEARARDAVRAQAGLAPELEEVS